MTQSGKWQLRIDMKAFDGDTAYAVYDTFSVGDASSNYELTIGTYSGTAGDSLSYHNNMTFSTKDRDNDAARVITVLICSRELGGTRTVTTLT